MQRNCCACCVELFKSQLSDHYSVDYLGKGRVFWFQSLFRVCLPYSLHIFRHLGRVYHFSLLICYPCSWKYFYQQSKQIWARIIKTLHTLLGKKGKGKQTILDSDNLNFPQLKKTLKNNFAQLTFYKNFRFWLNYKESQMDLT